MKPFASVLQVLLGVVLALAVPPVSYTHLPVKQDSAVVDVVIAQQQFHHGGLAGACRPDNSNLSARLYLGGKVVDDDFIGKIAEFDIFKLDTSFNLLRFHRLAAVRSFFRFREKLKNPLRRSSSGLKDVGDVHGLGNRLVKEAYILYKCLKMCIRDRHRE